MSRYRESAEKLGRICLAFKILVLLDVVCLVGIIVSGHAWIAVFLIPLNGYLIWLQVINYGFAYNFNETFKRDLDKILGDKMSPMDVRKGFANCEASYHVLASAFPGDKHLQRMNTLVLHKAGYLVAHLFLNFLILMSAILN